MSRWMWLAKLSIFVATFLVVTFGAGLAVNLSGATVSGTLAPGGVIALLIGGLTASWVLASRFEGRPLTTLGLRSGWPGLGDFGLGAGVGVLIIGVVILIMFGLGWVSWDAVPEPGSPWGTALALAALLTGAAFVEELLFRGYPFQVVARRFGPTAAILGTSLAFGWLHILNPNVSPLALVNITLAGVLLGVAYWRTGSLWLATGIHVGWNWSMAVSDLSVSGIDEMEMPLFDPTVLGPHLWTGGPFGPEGGLLVTLATLAGIAWLWRFSSRDESLSAFDSLVPEPTRDVPIPDETGG